MKTLLKFAASSLVVATLVVGCKPASETRPMALSSIAPSANKAAVKAAGRAAAALKARDAAKAIPYAESAVAADPHNASYRNLLGQAYLLGGRFASAGTSFRDALTLDPNQGRTALNLGLAEIAMGHPAEARKALADARGQVPNSDVGLALALAGDKEGAITVLEAAAREQGATSRTRQNLALAYAFAGRWREAQVIAAQDVPANELPARLQKWAQMARPDAAGTVQVAMLLGVTPSQDPGQPAQLALVPETLVPVDRALAAAVGAAAAPVPLVEAQAVPASEPQPVAVSEPVQPVAPVVVAEAPAPVVAPVPVEVAPQAVESAPTPQPVVTAEAEQRAATSIFQARPAPIMRVDPENVRPTSVMKLSMPTPAPKPAPVKPVKAEPAKLATPADDKRRKPVPAQGQFVVQLGAFSSVRNVETAWEKYSMRARHLGGRAPFSTTVRSATRTATLYRLSVGGFATRAEASALCRQVRASGGQCFVRTSAGDAPIQWARKENGAKGVALASR